MTPPNRWIAPIIAALLLPAHPAAAAQWLTVAAESGRSVEIDTSRLGRLKGDRATAWTRLTLDHPVLDFEHQLRYTAVEALNHYDCASGRFATQRRVFWLDGRAIRTEKVAAPQRIDVQPGSLDARLFDAACGPAKTETPRTTAAEARPRPMHAEMVSAGDGAPARSMTVADATAERPRFIDMPVIDKSKAEDPFRGNPPSAAPTPPPQRAAIPAPPRTAPQRTAPAAPVATATATAPPPAPPVAQEPSRQERERMLATSGVRRTPAKKPAEPAAPPPPDFSRVQWGYAGLGAPENWAKIRPGYALCGAGKRQSPIDIRGGIRVDLEPIKFDYRRTHFRIVDTGHTVRVDVGEGSSINVMGRVWPLDHFVFRRPGEERIGGKTYDMSLQLVHKDYDGTTAILAIPMERGAEHPVIQTLWNHMPLEVGMEVTPRDAVIDLSGLLPQVRTYFTYMGSLTTPPCTENVLWLVLKEPVQISQEQIGIFARLYPNNTRPLQPTHDRLIKGSR